MQAHAHEAHTVIVLKLMHCSWQSALHQLSRAHLLNPWKVSAKGGRLYLKMLLGFPGIHRHGQAIRAWWGVQSWVLVQVGQQERGADGGSVVQPRASVSVPACSVEQTGLSVALCVDEIEDHTWVSVVLPIFLTPRSCCPWSMSQKTTRHRCTHKKGLGYGSAGAGVLSQCHASAGWSMCTWQSMRSHMVAQSLTRS